MHAHAPNPDAIVRLTPKKAPFRRAGLHFETLEPVFVRFGQLTTAQLALLGEEPLIDVDGSEDGVRWERLMLPSAARDAARYPQAIDPARSPERAIDPTTTLAPHQPIETAAGYAAPPEAADPAVPLARSPSGERVEGENGGGRMVATEKLTAADFAADQVKAEEADAATTAAHKPRRHR